MNRTPSFDVAIIGGGIVGLAAAYALLRRRPLRLVILEAENRLAAHQTGHNSGVIHSGLYYRPGSLKALNCAQGREAMLRFCAENGVSHERCGKIVVALDESELSALDELEHRGRANGLEGLRRLSPEEIHELEPHCAGIAGLHVPQTGIVDFTQVAEAMARRNRELGAEIRTSARVVSVNRDGSEMVLETSGGAVRCRSLINCAGLQCDRVAQLCGLKPDIRIIPFRGEYYELAPERHSWVRNLIYPVPDPRFPFLGVHFTRMIDGGVEAGPNAVLALKREGYSRWSLSLRDSFATLRFPGFWRMARRHWQTGLGEVHRSFSKQAFVRALRRLMPELRGEDLRPGGAGVRAQAVGRDGKILDDFQILQSERMIHVLNAPSPAATASLSIGERIADLAQAQFSLE